MNKSYFPWNAIREERPRGRASFVLESNWELWKVKMVLMTVSVSILSADDNKLFYYNKAATWSSLYIAGISLYIDV